MYRFSFIVALMLVIGEANKLPSYITPCRKDDPRLVECAIRHGRAAIPYILKGDKENKLPPLAPYYIPEVTLQAQQDLTLRIKDVYIRGLENAVIVSGIIDLKKMRLGGTISIKSITIEGQFEIDGGAQIIPIRGSGLQSAAMTCENVTVEYTFDYELVKKKDGKEYIDNISPDVSYTVNKTYYHLENIFGGDKNLANSLNQFLNEHSEEIAEDFSSSTAEAIKVIVTAMVKRFTTTIPYEEFFI